MDSNYMLGLLDLIIIAVIGFGMYRGATKGIIKRATTVFSILAGVLLGWKLRPLMETLYVDYLHVPFTPQITYIVSFVTAFVVIFIIVSSVLSTLSGIFKSDKFQLDNALGAVFGGTLATAALSVVFVVLSFVELPSGQTRSNSALYPYVKGFVGYTLSGGLDALGEGYNLAKKFNLEPGASDTPAASQPADKPSPIR
ncbi:MAG: CvpA family protein [Bacteroidota bacterium]